MKCFNKKQKHETKTNASSVVSENEENAVKKIHKSEMVWQAFFCQLLFSSFFFNPKTQYNKVTIIVTQHNSHLAKGL